MICRYCQVDLHRAIARTWIIELQYQIPSQNRVAKNAGGHRAMAAYRAARDDADLELRLRARFVPRADGVTPRRVIIQRLYSGRQREYDVGNLCGGAKPLVDALVGLGLLHDDSPAHCSIWYRQDRAEASGTEITIEECA